MGFGIVNVIEDLVNWVAPRAGTVQGLRINVPTNTLGAASTFTIRRSASCNVAFAATTQTLLVGAATTGCFVTAGASVAIGPGDRISLEAATGGVVGSIIGTGGIEVV
jgi:hypothetical protein